MSRKLKILALSIFAGGALFVSSAMGMSYRYELNGVDFSAPEILENETEEGTAGYNYRAKYSLPVLTLMEFNANDQDDDGIVVAPDKYKVAWSVEKPEALRGLNFDFDSAKSLLTITGVLPESDDTYNFSVVAEIVECDYKEAISTKTNFDNEYKIYVQAGSHELITTDEDFKASVKPADGVDLHKATSKYSVTVRAPQRESHHELVYSSYVERENGTPVIDLPEWLKYEVSEKVKDEYNEEQVAAIIITLNKDVKVKDGTRAAVHVLFTPDKEDKNKSVGWDVLYSEEPEEEEKKEEAKPQKKGWFSW